MTVREVLVTIVLSASALTMRAAAEEIVYYDSNGFESPAYQPGPLAADNFLDGQDFWVGLTTTPPFLPDYNRITVQADLVKAGSSAVRFDASGHNLPAGSRIDLFRGAFFDLVHPLMVVDVDLYLSDAATDSGKWILMMQQDPLIPLTALSVFADGSMRADDFGLGQQVKLDSTFERGSWHHIRVVIDYASARASFKMDGASIGSVTTAPSVGAFALVGFFNDQQGNDSLFIDNLRIVNSVTAASQLGDVDSDGDVDIDDLLAVISAWGPCAPPCPADVAPSAGDGVVNILDLLIVISNWG